MNLNYTKSEVEASRAGAHGISWGRLISEDCLALMAEVERLQPIVDKLAKDAEGNVYPPPRALEGKVFYHPNHLGPATRLFGQLYWHPAGYWGVGCGGWEVPLAECYDTREAAEAARKECE